MIYKTTILILLSIWVPQVLIAEYTYRISEITPNIKQRMIKGHSWKKNCPVGLKDLRYLRISYFDFNGKTKIGEMIVHKNVAQDVTQIFETLYAWKYPIRRMKLISDYNGSDFQSIEADNTSAFNCRHLTGNKKKWSNHAYGKAIDINPIENPYVSRKGTSVHKASSEFVPPFRKHKNTSSPFDHAMLLKKDPTVKLFKDFGWHWGGDWKYIKDFQHFDKNNEPNRSVLKP
jgi:poly-gamma-glutamate synthesis protein (capsule biosynthesis protein)